MKKILATIFCFILMLACGTGKYVTTETFYTADGYGTSSVSKDMAYEKAYHAALSKVTSKNHVKNEKQDARIYGSTDTGRGKSAENLVYEETSRTESNMSTFDVKVKKVRYKNKGGIYECYIVINVPKDHIE